MTTKSLRETRSSGEAWWTTNQARSADDSQRIPCRMVFNALCFELTRERYDCRAITQIRTNPCAPASLESIIPILEQSLMFSTGDFFDNLVAIQMKWNLSCTTLLSAKCNYLPRNPDNGSAHVHGDRLLTASALDLAEIKTILLPLWRVLPGTLQRFYCPGCTRWRYTLSPCRTLFRRC